MRLAYVPDGACAGSRSAAIGGPEGVSGGAVFEISQVGREHAVLREPGIGGAGKKRPRRGGVQIGLAPKRLDACFNNYLTSEAILTARCARGSALSVRLLAVSRAFDPRSPARLITCERLVSRSSIDSRWRPRGIRPQKQCTGREQQRARDQQASEYRAFRSAMSRAGSPQGAHHGDDRLPVARHRRPVVVTRQ